MERESYRKISNELKILLWAIGINNESSCLELIDPNRKIDWDCLIDMSVEQGILPQLFTRLTRQSSVNLPQAVLKKLKTSFFYNAIHNFKTTKKLIKILEIFSKRNLKVAFLRGTALAVQAYGDIALRNFGDIDILIDNRDFSQVYDLLVSNGFQSHNPKIGKMKRIWARSRRNFEFQKMNYYYDFHQQVVQGPKFLNQVNIHENLSSVELFSKQVPTLNIEDTILMLALHGVHHGWIYLKLAADLAHLIHSHKEDISWEKLIRKAKRMGSLRILWIGLILSRDFCQLRIPADVQNMIEKDNRAKQLACKFKTETLRIRKSNRIPVMAFPRSLDSFLYKIRYLLYHIFNPTDLDLLTVKLPGFLYPVYFVIRPLRLGINFMKEVFNKSMRRKN